MDSTTPIDPENEPQGGGAAPQLPVDGENNLGFKNRIPLEELRTAVEGIRAELGKIIIGQHEFIELLIVALLSDGHVLIEGVPGIAKTITAKLFAKTLHTDFGRIQFTQT